MRIVLLGIALLVCAGCAQQSADPGPVATTAHSNLFSFNFSAPKAAPALAYGDLTRDPPNRPQVFAGDAAAPPPPVAAADQAALVRYADASNQMVPAGNGSYELNFESADVGAVTKVILGDILKVNYLLDKRVTGQVTLTSSQPVPKSKLVPLLEASLATIGASVVKDRDFYRVVPSADPGGIGQVDYRSAGIGFGTSVIMAKFVPATTLGHLLDNFGSRAGSVRVDATSNLVIVQGTENERSAAIDAARLVDVDWLRSRSVAILPVSNSAPDTVISELNRILDTGEGGLSQGVVQLQPITRLNAVLAVSRRPDAIETVKKWVLRLDREDVRAAGVKVYRLQYAQAKTVAAALNDLFGSGSSGGASDKDALEPSSQDASHFGSAGSSNSAAGSQAQPGGGSSAVPAPGVAAPAPQGGSGTSQSAFGVLKAAFEADSGKTKGDGTGGGDAAGGGGGRSGSSKVRVTADIGSNSLLINATPAEYKLVERAIRQIDRQPIEVEIEATIAEVTLTSDLQFGVQFYLQQGKVGAGLSGIQAIPLAAPTAALGASLLIGSAANPKVLLNALQSVTSVNILSTPSLVVLDRQPAVLQVGDQVPILTQQAQSVLTAGSPVVNSVDYKDTGVILNVLPRVNANGIVSLDIQQEVSAVSSTDPTTLTPTISQRRVRSSVAVANGQTVMLGGLISETQSNSREGLPGLSSLKFLGDLLSSHDNSTKRTEIIIFIRPQIIANPADAQSVTQEFRDRLTEMRRESEPAVIRRY